MRAIGAAIAAALAAAACLLWAIAAEARCGTHGGPGYRDVTGRCVSWAEIRRVCGCPPSKGCRPERVDPVADAAACEPENLRERRGR